MVNTIVVGVDGSADSQRAVDWAARLAEQTHARVIALHAVGLLEHELGDPAGAHLRPQLDAWTAALDRLDAAKVERRLVGAEPVGAISDVVAGCDGEVVVVVGTRGTGVRGSARLGSTSLRLAESCRCPIVIVPQSGGVT